MRAAFAIALSAGAAFAQSPAEQEKFYELQVQQRPTAENWQRLGLARHLQNRFDSAIPAFEQAIKLDPSLWTAHLFLGIGLYRTNRFADALTSLEKSERLAPKSQAGRDEVDFWLAATQIALGQKWRGLGTVETLLARNPRHLEGLELAAKTYTDVGSSIWNELADDAPETPQAYEILGYALEDEADHSRALEALRTAESLAPARPGPRLAIGRILLKQEKPKEALEVLRDEIATSTDPRAFLFGGLAAAQTGDRELAIQWLKQAERWPSTQTDAGVALKELK